MLLLASVANFVYAQEGQQQPKDSSKGGMNRFKIRNLGTVINTSNLEYAPTITADGKTLYYVSNRPGGVGGHDFWVTSKKDRLDTVFVAPKNVAKPVNTNLNEGVASIAADGQTIYFTACERPDGLGDCDIYQAELDGTVWKNIRNITELNSAEWDSQPSISSDGKTIYFVSTRDGAMGGDGDVDIYVSNKQADGKWSKPKNLGAPINTPAREDSPFLIAGGQALYFSSAGHGGFGGLDFFVAKLGSDKKWGTPENLGRPYNTPQDERFITLPAAGDIVYFSSERTDLPNAGQLDIFMGILPPKVVTILVSGKVYDRCTGQNLPADIVFINEETGDTVQRVKNNAASGEYSFVLNAGKAMKLKGIAISKGYPNGIEVLPIPETKEYKELKQDFVLGMSPQLGATYEISDYVKNLPPTAPEKSRNFRGLVIEEVKVRELFPLLTYVFFDSGNAVIPDRYVLFSKPEETVGFDDEKIPGGTMEKYHNVLNVIGFRLKKFPETKITIVGCNSDEAKIGEVRDVSEKRGQIVYDYLIKIWQIDASRIKLLPARNLPERVSNRRDPLGIVENRRTEINSDDWEIMKPILQVEYRLTPQPDTMHFQMKNGINNDLVAKRAIEIKRYGKMWAVLGNIGKTDAVSPEYNWGKNGNVDSVPGANDTGAYSAQLVVYDKNGKECRSNIVDIPVMFVSSQQKRIETTTEKMIDKLSLVLFKFDSPDPGMLNDRILREFIYPEIKPGAKISVTGYTDVVGLDDRNMKLSGDRARSVTNGISKNVKQGVYQSLDGKGVGETDPLYANDLPEGRFYNRTVQVVIETPVSTSP